MQWPKNIRFFYVVPISIFSEAGSLRNFLPVAASSFANYWKLVTLLQPGVNYANCYDIGYIIHTYMYVIIAGSYKTCKHLKIKFSPIAPKLISRVKSIDDPHIGYEITKARIFGYPLWLWVGLQSVQKILFLKNRKSFRFQ